METPNKPSIASPIVPCTLTVENLTRQGTTQKSVTYKNCKLILGRNEFRDVLLQVEHPKQLLTYDLHEFTVYKKFLKEGKATIKVTHQQLNLMVSNAPPNALLIFLKLLCAKTVAQEPVSKLSVRQRLLSNLPQTFEEISPLNIKEYDKLRVKEGKLPLREYDKADIQGVSPVSSKRKRNGMENEVVRRKVPRFLNPIQLNKEQKRVLNAVQTGNSIFFTGSAGTGKSFLLKHIIGTLPPEVTVVTASTGVAACQIGGTTLHAFAGIGSGNAPLEQCIELANRKTVRDNWRKCKVLIIDEVSMVDGQLFKKLEAVGRAIRKCNKPFGGIQLILCGDFLQLPPVVGRGEKREFAFQCTVWQTCVPLAMQLTQVKRQQGDQRFVDILQNIRMGRCSEKDASALRSTMHNCVERDGIKATRLCTHKEDVEHINNAQLEKLPGHPIVKFACGVTTEVKPEKCVIKLGAGNTVSRRQIPLKLAWAFSIHKSQGMTLDCVEMSLSRVFESGQAYVALSRARSLQSLRVLDFTPGCIKSHPDVLKFYRNLNYHQSDYVQT